MTYGSVLRNTPVGASETIRDAEDLIQVGCVKARALPAVLLLKAKHFEG